jgi:hypothetical protein
VSWALPEETLTLLKENLKDVDEKTGMRVWGSENDSDISVRKAMLDSMLAPFQARHHTIVTENDWNVFGGSEKDLVEYTTEKGEMKKEARGTLKNNDAEARLSAEGGVLSFSRMWHTDGWKTLKVADKNWRYIQVACTIVGPQTPLVNNKVEGAAVLFNPQVTYLMDVCVSNPDKLDSVLEPTDGKHCVATSAPTIASNYKKWTQIVHGFVTAKDFHDVNSMDRIFVGLNVWVKETDGDGFGHA